MGVFSRTMLMLAIAWLVGLNVAFIFMQMDPEPDWRDKFVAEANIRRAIAYRYVDIKGGRVAEHGTDQGRESADKIIDAESLGNAPFGLEGEGGSGGSTDALPGALIEKKHSLLDMERSSGDQAKQAQSEAVNGKMEGGAKVKGLNEQLADLEKQIAENQRAWRKALSRSGLVADKARHFGAEMQAFRYIIASFQQKVFNLDYEIQRVIIERDSLTAELAQVKNDIERIKRQEVELEDVYFELSRDYTQTVKILAMYEQIDPNIRKMADMAGRTWLNGRVVAVGDDINTGVVTISIGRQVGVESNQMFTIHRGGKVIGKMRVEQIEDNFAVGRLVEADRGKVTVLENDSIKASATFGTATVR